MSQALTHLRQHAASLGFTEPERVYLFQLHSGLSRGHVAALFGAVAAARNDAYHGDWSDWQQAGRALLTKALTSARNEGLLSEGACGRGLQAALLPTTADELLALLLDTRAALDARRRTAAAKKLTTADRALLEQERRAA